MSKYGNRKTVVDGIAFDSAREARRYEELRILERCGCITDLRRQVEYELIPNQYEVNGKKKRLIERRVKYVADFVYEENGETVVEDVKGVRTKEYVLKRKWMLYRFGIRIREV